LREGIQLREKFVEALELDTAFAQTHVRLSLIFEQAGNVIAPKNRVAWQT